MSRSRFAPALALCALALACLPAAHADARKGLKGIKEAVKANDAAKLGEALDLVTADGGKAGAKGLLEILEVFPKDKPNLYWPVLNAVCSFTDPKAIKAIGDYLLKNGSTPAAQDVLFGMQNNQSPELLDVYRRILKKRGHPLQTLACDRLGELENAGAVDLLLEVLAKEDGKGTALERRIKSTLTSLFGEDMGDLTNWQGWWDANRETAFKTNESSSTGTVKDELGAARKGGLTSMSRRGGKVIVLRSINKNFDEIEKMLTRLEVKHTVVMKRAFMDDMEGTLKGVAAVILNCNFYERVCTCGGCTGGLTGGRLPQCNPNCPRTPKHQWQHDMLTGDARKRLVKFVAEGGSVFTEDWGLKELTGKAWKDYVTVGADLQEQKVDYAPVPGQTGTPLLRGVMRADVGAGASATRSSTKAMWKVDNKSPAIKIMDPEKVKILLASETLRGLASSPEEKLGAVAVYFEPGADAGAEGDGKRRPKTGGKRRRRGKGDDEPQGGIVLHVLSHFGKQGTKQDEFTLQNLLVNWLLEAQERYAAAKAAK